MNLSTQAIRFVLLLLFLAVCCFCFYMLFMLLYFFGIFYKVSDVLYVPLVLSIITLIIFLGLFNYWKSGIILGMAFSLALFSRSFYDFIHADVFDNSVRFSGWFVPLSILVFFGLIHLMKDFPPLKKMDYFYIILLFISIFGTLFYYF